MQRKFVAGAMATVAAVALIGVAAYGQTVRAAGIVADISVPTKADNFRLVDQNSKSHELYYFKNAKAVVIISQANGVKHVRDAAPAIKELENKYAGQGVVFLMLNPSLDADRKAIVAEMQSVGLDLPVLMDSTQLISEGLGVSRAAQAFVIQPSTWNVVYSGPIDNRFAGKTSNPKAALKNAYLADALDSLMAGKPVAVASAKLDSPTLSFPQRDRRADFSQISYAKEVSPILEKNCVACHSAGGIAPFAMDSYEKVKGFSPMIREAIRTDRMPPYNADPHVGQFRDSNMNLSDRDVQTLVHWIEAGAPRGAGEDPLKLHAKPAPEWELGAPDLILDVPAFDVPASGVVDYQYPQITVPVTEKRYIRAVTFNVGHRQAVHHIVSPVGDYAVGAETIIIPEGQGIPVTPGQVIRPSMHYTPFGKAVTDKTRIGLYFYPKDKPPEKIRQSIVVANAGIEIPPNEKRHKAVAYGTFKRDATLYFVFPHAHYRGENAQVFLQKPGQKEELIVSLPKYDFNWQRGYYFEHPVDVPAGTKIITRYEYDNSKDNPANPDPNATVTWGEQSWEEMQYTQLGVTWKDETVDNPKPGYNREFAESRGMGILDSNIDGRIEKSELRGRMGQVVLTNFEKLDTNKDGAISEQEAVSLTPLLNRRVQQAEDALATGASKPEPQRQ
jgi:hypothetical protein